jgi:hypothetical protein
VKKWIVIALLSISGVGCKQGLGERCQVTADCAEGICSSSEPKVCVTSADGSGGGMFDAEPPADSSIDAPPPAVK